MEFSFSGGKTSEVSKQEFYQSCLNQFGAIVSALLKEFVGVDASIPPDFFSSLIQILEQIQRQSGKQIMFQVINMIK